MEKQSIEELKKEFPIHNVNVRHRNSLSSLEKLAVFATQRIGTMGFFFIIFTWSTLWLCWNIFTPKSLHFDPFPAFVLWLFISNLIQLHLLPLIMVGQNIQGRHAQLRSEHDYETDKKAEKGIEAILLRLESQQEIILNILKKIEKMEQTPK